MRHTNTLQSLRRVHAHLCAACHGLMARAPHGMLHASRYMYLVVARHTRGEVSNGILSVHKSHIHVDTWEILAAKAPTRRDKKLSYIHRLRKSSKVAHVSRVHGPGLAGITSSSLEAPDALLMLSEVAS